MEQIIKVDIKVLTHIIEDIECEIIDESSDDIQNMIMNYSAQYELKPKEKDFEKLYNDLDNVSKQNLNSPIEMIFSNKYPKDRLLYVVGVNKNDLTKSISIWVTNK